jgi:hypothetical protein
VRLNAQDGMSMATSNPTTAFTTFTIKPQNDIMVMYVGSVDPAQNGSLIFSWKNDVRTPTLHSVISFSFSVVVLACAAALSIFI